MTWPSWNKIVDPIKSQLSLRIIIYYINLRQFQNFFAIATWKKNSKEFRKFYSIIYIDKTKHNKKKLNPNKSFVGCVKAI